MPDTSPLHFKVATEPAEFEQIYRLNHQTFVEEIVQHAPRSDGRLVDRFDAENTYFICRRGERVVGMVAMRGRRPFSLDAKLPDLEAYLPPGRLACEVRLLAVAKEHRGGVVFRGLIELLTRHFSARGYDLAVISGTVRQLKLYRSLGFVPFGPIVGTPEAPYQPMYLTLETFRTRKGGLFGSPAASDPASFLPGPVELSDPVRRRLASEPVSHRGARFAETFAAVRRQLCALTGAPHVQLLFGSGTLANDAVGAQLAGQDANVLVLSNGEFGERLVDHAARWRLRHRVLRLDWGKAFTREAVEAALDDDPSVRWIWGVHCETSTGVLNDLEMLEAVAARQNIGLCMDCISSIGSVDVDLRGVEMATGVSGKGIGAAAGVAFVFHRRSLRTGAGRLPRYLDLGMYEAADGMPFTQSSLLVGALDAALERYADPQPVFAATAAAAGCLRRRLAAAGFDVVAGGEEASPAVTTIALPPDLPVRAVGLRMEDRGYLLSFNSSYLVDRNWIQVCLMGAFRADLLEALVDTLADVVQEISAERCIEPAIPAG